MALEVPRLLTEKIKRWTLRGVFYTRNSRSSIEAPIQLGLNTWNDHLSGAIDVAEPVRKSLDTRRQVVRDHRAREPVGRGGFSQRMEGI